MAKYSGREYANPSAWYKEGVAAEKVMKEARAEASRFLSANPEEIVFTAGGTEANNLAIIGAVEGLHSQGLEYEQIHILISAIEHSSVRECANRLSDLGVAVETINVKNDGIVDLDDLKNKLKPNTSLVSVMTVNNEIGSIEPIKEISKIIRQHRQENFASSPFAFQQNPYPIFHTDASQATLLDLDTRKSNVDLLTLDAAKMYGPRGIGLLYIRRNTVLEPVIFGGGQEKGLRSGTENVAAIAGFAKALSLAAESRQAEFIRLAEIKKVFWDGFRQIKPEARQNGEGQNSPHIINISVPGLDAEFAVIKLDALGVACSTKSACLRDEAESYVLKSIGAPSKYSLRFSFGRYTSFGDIKKVLKILSSVLGQNEAKPK